MNKSRKIAVAFLLSVFSITPLLSGCTTEKEDDVAGVDDFPNSIYARMQGNLDDAGEGSKAPVPAQALVVLQGAPSGPAIGGLPKAGGVGIDPITGLPKAGAASATHQVLGAPTPEDAEFAIGLPEGLREKFATDSTWIFFTVSQSDPEKKTVDTLFFKRGTLILDSVSRALGLVATKRTEVYANGKVTVGIFRDGDGDGAILTPLDSAKVSVLFLNRVDGITETAYLQSDGGLDGNLSTEADNRIYAAEWLRTLGDDTLSRAAYSDADDDGIVLDNAAASLVDITLFEREPKDKPEVAERSLKVRVVASYKTEPKEIKRFSAVERLRNGSLHTVAMSNAEGGEDLNVSGKTRVVMVVSETPASDSVESLEVESIIKPETAIGADRDSVFGYSAKMVKRMGEEKSATFSFIAGVGDRPAPPKTSPRNGKVTFEIIYRDDTRVNAEGELKDGALSASITARDGTLYDMEWDAEGKVIRAHITKP